MIHSVHCQPHTSAKPPAESTPKPPQGDATGVQTRELRLQSGSTEYSGSKDSGPALAGNKGVDAYRAVEDAGSNLNPTARTISRFIEAQLARDVADGASQEALQSRLEAGLQGFLQGFGEAEQMLEGMGLLSEDVAAVINETKSQVLGELSRMADELGLEMPEIALEPAEPAIPATPVTEAPAPVVTAPVETLTPKVESRDQLKLDILTSFTESMRVEKDTYAHLGKARNDSTPYQYSVAQKRSFEFELTTRDGDKVLIKADASQAYVQKSDSDGLRGAMNQSGGYDISVEGELDADELKAINQLLQDVNALAGEFYEGDLNRAFEMARQLSFDTSEIAGYALDLQQTTLEKLQASPVAGKDSIRQTLEPLLDFTRQLIDLGRSAQESGLRQSEFIELAAKLLERHQSSTVPGSTAFDKPAFARDLLSRI